MSVVNIIVVPAYLSDKKQNLYICRVFSLYFMLWFF